MRDFWWGNKPEGQRQLYLAAWKSICVPKQAGGLGFKLCTEMNNAFMKKLLWTVATCPHKTWVKLIKAKYLRGKPLLDYQAVPQGASWILRGLLHNLEPFKAHICYRVGNPTMLNIWRDP